MSDRPDLYDRAIIRAVRGEDSPWKIDSRYPAKGRTWEERITGKGGKPPDKQALLWAIEQWGEERKAMPPWAHIALRRLLLDTVKGKSGKTWDGAFGKLFNDRKGRSNTERLVGRVQRLGDQILELWKNGYSLGDGENSVWDKLSGDRKRLKGDWTLYKKLRGLPERMKRK